MFGIYTGSIGMMEGSVPPDLIGAPVNRIVNGAPGNVNIAKTVLQGGFNCKLMVVMQGTELHAACSPGTAEVGRLRDGDVVKVVSEVEQDGHTRVAILPDPKNLKAEARISHTIESGGMAVWASSVMPDGQVLLEDAPQGTTWGKQSVFGDLGSLSLSKSF